MPSADRLIEIFNEAKARPAGPERDGFLTEACGDDLELKGQVLSLLQAHESAGEFLGAGPALSPEIEAELARLKPEEVGERIGPYKLREQIGEGGFGVVWVAEQQEPVRRTVALKIIKMGMDTKEVVARFEQERQALAMMDHPNIAKVFDAGATEHGRPFFVMELVRGIKITEYCDQANLPTTARLALFITVCHAVQHAHQKGIIHRDLKPSNILVTLHDGVPVPKIIDFGVAKATQAQRLTDLTIYTQFQQMIGTPLYMSPEQAEMSGLDIDTRSDIYSLGVLLYELLTGRTPFDPEELMKQGLDEIRRVIREQEPQTPSMLLKTMADDTRATVALHRQSDPAKLTNLMRGDLDWIVMKALEKDRVRRYETAKGLADDIERHFANEPVLARRASQLYRFRRLVKRNRLAFAAGSAVVLALLAGIAVSTWQAVRATDAERTATEERTKAVTERNRALTAEKVAQKQRKSAEQNLYAASMNLAQAAWEQADVRRVRQILEETRSYPDRGFEWFYWQRQTHLELRTLPGPPPPVLLVAFSPDGRRMLTVSEWYSIRAFQGRMDTTAKTWDVETGRELVTLKGHTDRVSSVAFSSDGRRIITGSNDKTARMWDAETGRELLTLKGHTASVESAAFSFDGRRILTGSSDKTAKAWDAETGRELLTLKGHTASVDSAAFSPDGLRIITGNRDTTAKVWDAKTGRALLTLGATTDGVSWVAFSPDGRRILTRSGDGTAKTWNAGTGRELLTLRGQISLAVFSPDGRQILTSSGDTTAKTWDAETGRELLTLKGHASSVEAAAFSPDGRQIFTSSSDGTIKVWDAEVSRELLTISGLKADAMSGGFSPDGRRIITSSNNKAAKMWDAETGRELFTLKGHELAPWPVAFSPDGRRILTGSVDETAKTWDAETGRELLTLPHTDAVLAATFSPDGRQILTGSGDSMAKTWDAESGRELLTLKGHTRAIWSVAFSPDGRQIITGGWDHTARTWNAETGRELLTLKGHANNVNSVAFSPDGRRILTGSDDHTAKLWDAETGRELLTFKGHSDSVGAVAFSSDGRRILTGSWDETVKIWDAESGRELLTLKERPFFLNSISFSPDGRRILVRSPDTTARMCVAASPEDVDMWQKEEEARKGSGEPYAVMGDLKEAINLKNWDEADAKFAVAEKLVPKERRVELLWARFDILHGRKNYPAASQVAEKLSDAYPGDIELQDKLVWEVITREVTEPRDLDLAEKIATRANKAAKGNEPQILNTLARVFFMQGKVEAAIQFQNQAVALAEGTEKEDLQKTLDSYQKGELPKR